MTGYSEKELIELGQQGYKILVCESEEEVLKQKDFFKSTGKYNVRGGYSNIKRGDKTHKVLYVLARKIEVKE